MVYRQTLRLVDRPQRPVVLDHYQPLGQVVGFDPDLVEHHFVEDYPDLRLMACLSVVIPLDLERWAEASPFAVDLEHSDLASEHQPAGFDRVLVSVVVHLVRLEASVVHLVLLEVTVMVHLVRLEVSVVAVMVPESARGWI